MTSILLHGGHAGAATPRNDEFFRAMVQGASGPVRLLLIPFARKTSTEREEVSQRHSLRIQWLNQGVSLSVTIAEAAKLAEQIRQAEVVYMVGGDTATLVSALRAVPNITELLIGKTLAGSSAGAYALVKYYRDNDTAKLGEGLGLLNIKVFAHFSPSVLPEYNELAQYQENLPIIALPEGEWVRLES